MALPIQTVIDGYQALINGIQKDCPTASFLLGGKTYTAADAVALLASLRDAAIAERNAKAAWHDARAAGAQLEATDGLVARELRQVLSIAFSGLHTELADFGLVPRKPRVPLDTVARLAATAKLRATRKARGTTSRKQKLAITGSVTGVTIAPIVSGEST
jgi:hypothetical protein